MQLRALRPWYNSDHEGEVDVGQFFEASDYRARDLIRNGLAVPATGPNGKIHVPADPPPPARPRRAPRHR
jgi:hypothetical protein